MMATTPHAGGEPRGILTPPNPGADFHPGSEYFAATRAAFGDEGLSLAIGPLRMRLEGLSATQAGRLEERFHPFIEQAAGRIDLRIELRRAAVSRFLEAPAPGVIETYRMESRPEGERIAIWSYEFAGWVDPAAGRAELDLAQAEGPIFDRGLENFLRVMTATFILRRGGLLLHGSGVVRHGRAYVFFGPSGAGKTTVTHLSPDDLVLSDDLTLIVPGEGAVPCAAGIPFGMAHHREPQTNRSFPLASLNRLVQSAQVRRTPVPYAQAVAEVASSMPFVMRETGQALLAVEAAAALLRAVPAYRLEFRKDDAFWAVVEER